MAPTLWPLGPQRAAPGSARAGGGCYARNVRVSGSPSGSKRTTNNLSARRPPPPSASSGSLLPAPAFLPGGGAAGQAPGLRARFPRGPGPSRTHCASPHATATLCLQGCGRRINPLGHYRPPNASGLPLTPSSLSAGRRREMDDRVSLRGSGCCCGRGLGGDARVRVSVCVYSREGRPQRCPHLPVLDPTSPSSPGEGKAASPGASSLTPHCFHRQRRPLNCPVIVYKHLRQLF